MSTPMEKAARALYEYETGDDGAFIELPYKDLDYYPRIIKLRWVMMAQTVVNEYMDEIK